MVEYWAHVAAYMPVDLWPYMRHRMEGYRERGHAWTQEKASAQLVDSLISEIRDERRQDRRATSTTGCPGRRSTGAGTGARPKRALEYLFISGELAVAGRNSQFERVYDLPERVIPAAVLDQPAPDSRTRPGSSCSAGPRARHGVATARCLRDYYRLQLERGEGAADDDAGDRGAGRGR